MIKMALKIVLAFVLFASVVYCTDTFIKEVGKECELECKAQSSGDRCSWVRATPDGVSDVVVVSGSILSPESRLNLTDNPRNGDCSLSIRDLQMDDSAYYTCRIEPVFKQVIQLIVGAVPDKPEIFVNEERQEDGAEIEHSRHPINLQCIVSNGKPQAGVVWKIGEKLVDGDNEVIQIDDHLVTVISRLNLKVNKVDRETVTCRAAHVLYPKKLMETTVTFLPESP